MSLVTVNRLEAQVNNDECDFAKFLPDINDYCSKDNEFTNKGATVDPFVANSCLISKYSNGVWFSFVAKQPAISIRVFSTGGATGIKGPKTFLFADCNDFLECSPGKASGGDEFLYNKLILGKTYYVMVISDPGGEGTFKFCIDELTSVKIPESDCVAAVKLCDKTPFVVNSLLGSGNNTNEIEPGNCINSEFQSSWYKWTCDKSGSLTFTLTPNNNSANLKVDVTDDLDFAVYELPNGIDDCNGKILKRCIASGANTTGNIVDPVNTWFLCNGPTGLNATEMDITEEGGCKAGQNSFGKALDMESGKSYVLVVNNFSRSGLGFSIKMGGTGTFLGPTVDYVATALDRFECDKAIDFTNKSFTTTDSIDSYSWNFGEGATPNSSTIFGPLSVTYNSFGDKKTALTVTTTKGCTVTKFVDLTVNACCKDTSTLAVSALPKDVPCFNNADGLITAIGKNGSPKYTYSLDSVNFQPISRFTDLKAGNYTIFIRDKKGCLNKTLVTIKEPPPVIVDAGEDIVVELGESSVLNGSSSGGTGIGLPKWTPKDSIAFDDQFSTPFLPLKDKEYTLTVTDENGCTGSDVLRVSVKIVRPVFAPNIIKKGSEGINGNFHLSGGKAVKKIKVLEVYDRWGNKVYKGQDLNINDLTEGWQGDFNGKKVVSGVYVWLAVVQFIDDVELTLSGDVTVVD